MFNKIYYLQFKGKWIREDKSYLFYYDNMYIVVKLKEIFKIFWYNLIFLYINFCY